MKPLRILTLGLAFSLLVVLLAACQVVPTPTAVPTLSVPSVTPRPSPTPSRTPLPPQPPRLLSFVPEEGEELAPDGAIVFRFDQPMDKASVEKAFQLAPHVEGVFTWEGPSVLRFRAEQGFQRDTLYKVRIDTSAKSAKGLSLTRPIVRRFRVVGYLEVANVFPEPGSRDVKPTSAIRVVFNRPVVPLVGLGEKHELLDPLEISPFIPGEGEWLNTALYVFKPARPLSPGTEYTVKIAAGLRDTTGGILEQDYVWSFVTEPPKVLSVQPADGSRFVSPRPMLRLTFNQAMERQATQARFSLLDEGGKPVPGQFAWEEKGRVLVFTPSRSLKRGGNYTIMLKAGALVSSGKATIAQTHRWRFQVAELPRVVDVYPQNGADIAVSEDIQITFSCPIDKETLLDGFTITPTAKVHVYWQDWKGEGTVVRISASFKPSTEYSFSLNSKVKGRYGRALVEGITVRFRTRAYEPLVYLDVPGPLGMYNAYSDPTVYVRYRNVSQVRLSLYRLSEKDFVALNKEKGWRLWDRYRGDEAELVRRWVYPVSAPLNTTEVFSVTLSTREGQRIPSGLYYLELSSPGVKRPQRHVLVVSPMNLTLKSTPSGALIWATDLQDGQPLQGVQLAIYNAKGRQVALVETDSKGVARANFSVQEPWAPLIVLARGGSGVGAVLRHWSDGIAPWDFGFQMEPVQTKYRLYFYTDRRIYRPGQVVHFKGIVRLDQDAQYELPPKGSLVRVTVSDSQGRKFWQAELPLNELGTVHGEFQLAEDAPLGYYQLLVVYEEQAQSFEFQVAEYRKPEFQVQVALDKEDYISGDVLRVQAEASYFFGGPVAHAPVRWRVLRKPYFFDRWQSGGHYSFTDYDYSIRPRPLPPFGEVVAEGRGETDAQGRMHFSLPLDLEGLKQSQRYVVEVSVTDLNYQEVSARKAAIVHRGEFYIGLAADRYVGTANKELFIRALTVDIYGERRPSQEVQVIVYRREWYSVKEQADDGRFYWRNKVRDTAVVTRTVHTDERGEASMRFIPPVGGVYRVVASGQDSRGNQVSSALYLWVSGERFINWGRWNDDRLELVADKKSYRPGERAHILVPSPYQGPVRALVTIERGGVLEYQVLELNGNSEQLVLPIKPEYAPNVYVSVVLVKGMQDGGLPGFKVGYALLPVSTEQKELQVTITPDRQGDYKPREKVTFKIVVRDHQGHGVPAELSLQLVDLAVETLVGEAGQDIVQAFYRQRGLGVSTATSLVLSVDRHNLEYPTEGKGGGGGAKEMVIAR
ncbi:MAG: Ig-like domain-containing protein, partial [Anaerolineae bacterium]|nr:Ig-like domain-containing protein [Anaerolineae bacterium]